MITKLCDGAWAIPPTPLMIEHDNTYHTCSKCGEPTDPPKPAKLFGPEVAGEPAAIRLSKQIGQYHRLKPETPRPNADQIWMVLHALADHTAIMAALEHRPDPTSPWPQATSVGRWLQDTGDQAESML